MSSSTSGLRRWLSMGTKQRWHCPTQPSRLHYNGNDQSPSKGPWLFSFLYIFFSSLKSNLLWWSFLQGLLLFSLLAAWIISMKMDIPDTTSSIRQIRISDRDPGKTKQKQKILTKTYDFRWNFHGSLASKGTWNFRSLTSNQLEQQ